MTLRIIAVGRILTSKIVSVFNQWSVTVKCGNARGAWYLWCVTDIWIVQGRFRKGYLRKMANGWLLKGLKRSTCSFKDKLEKSPQPKKFKRPLQQ